MRPGVCERTGGVCNHAVWTYTPPHVRLTRLRHPALGPAQTMWTIINKWPDKWWLFIVYTLQRFATGPMYSGRCDSQPLLYKRAEGFKGLAFQNPTLRTYPSLMYCGYDYITQEVCFSLMSLLVQCTHSTWYTVTLYHIISILIRMCSCCMCSLKDLSVRLCVCVCVWKRTGVLTNSSAIIEIFHLSLLSPVLFAR